MHFSGFRLIGNVPDARTVRAFREALKQHPLLDAFFKHLNRALADLAGRWTYPPACIMYPLTTIMRTITILIILYLPWRMPSGRPETPCQPWTSYP